MQNFKEVLAGIKPLDQKAMAEASTRMDNLIKPIGSLGRLEDIAIQLAGITGRIKNKIEKKCTVVMSADNGVMDEGVSAAPQVVTLIQTENMFKGICGINVLSEANNADIRVVDIGINGDIHCPGLISRKIRKGTSNMAKGPAMSRDEAIKAIETGIEVVKNLVDEGYNLFGTGEMGIGNTSTSSAMLMCFTGCSAEVAVGKGAGLTEEDFNKKKRIIAQALKVNSPDPQDPIDVLAKVGGFDIAGLVGCFLAAAYYRVPIVIDGFISGIAALTAYKLNPLVKGYLIPSHASAEPGYDYMIKAIGLEPILLLKMRLGEGSGCPLAFNVIEGALAIMNNMATFEEGAISSETLVDIREEE
ncbi:MAG: nicotinate-nucleotide--dimethylbenzimidazole phosphoribosyltransferase [Bacillota bacterium]|jgi:nicotinate-nucleotide--dimethylbenzimidazole phosphoribosyltransferase